MADKLSKDDLVNIGALLADKLTEDEAVAFVKVQHEVEREVRAQRIAVVERDRQLRAVLPDALAVALHESRRYHCSVLTGRCSVVAGGC